MKILNLYAGLGGNRKLWGDEHEIVAVEKNLEIQKYYMEHYPNDHMDIDRDVIHYLENTDLDAFDFIWASPPCQTHGQPAIMYSKYIPRLTEIFGIILFLKRYFKGIWVIENVKPWYIGEFVFPVTQILGRHFIWSNFPIPHKQFNHPSHHNASFQEVAEWLDMDIPNIKNYRGHDPNTQTLRNCVHPEIGKYILDCAMKKINTLENYISIADQINEDLKDGNPNL